jgi:hypothetical protein
MHRTVDDVPYNLLFGHMPRVGISNLPLANELINTLATEAQLNRVCNYIGKVVIPDEELPAVIGDDNNVHKVLQGQGDQDQAADTVFNAEIAYAEMTTAPNENDGVLVGEIGEPDDNEDGDDSGIPLATIVFEPEQEPALGAAASSTIANHKTAEDKEDNVVSRWETAVHNVPNDFTMDGFQDICPRVSVPVAWCKDVCNNANLMSFVPAYLTRISKHEWKVTDEDEIPLTSLVWDSEEGLQNLVGCGYIQYPMSKYVDFFRCIGTTGAISTAQQVTKGHAVSCKRAALRSRAAGKQETSAKKMRQTDITKMGGQENVFFIGEVVQVPVADVDKAKVDNHTLAGVIVPINYARLAVRVVVTAGLLQSWYQYHRLSRVTGPGNNIKLLGLETAFLGWTTMKEVSEREASRKESVVGGQGKGTVICTCKGKCDSKICKCFKAGRICSSACHRNNKKCTNHDHEDKDKE